MQNQAKKTTSSNTKTGTDGEQLLARGHKIALRRWHERPNGNDAAGTSEPYEIAGYLIKGSLTIAIEDQESMALQAGDSWTIPAGVKHSYTIHEDIDVVEAITV